MMPRKMIERKAVRGIRGIVCAALLAGAVGETALAHPHVWVTTETTVLFENGAVSGLRYTWLFDEMYTVAAIDGLDKNNDGKLDAAELEELTKVNIEGLKEFDYFTTATLAGQAVTFGNAKDYSMELKEVEETAGPQMIAGPSTTSAQAADPRSPGLWARIAAWWSSLFGRAQAPASTAGSQGPAAGASNGGPGREKSKVLALTLTLPLKQPLAADALTNESKGFQFAVNDPQMYIWFEPAAKGGFRLSAGAPHRCRAALIDAEQDEQQKKLAEAFGRLGSVAMGGPGKVMAVICDQP